jgi:hypothetical protein
MRRFHGYARNSRVTFVLWFLIPFLIFLSRVLDVSIGSLRMLCAAKGQRIAAPLLGFCEILIWITALRAVLSEPANPSSTSPMRRVSLPGPSRASA